MAIRILHCADIHLGARCSFLEDDTKIETRTRDFQDTFARITDYAADPDNRIDLVIVAGDLFDMAVPEPPLVEYVAQRFRRLAQRGVHVYVVPGTHDTFADPRSVYRQDDQSLGAVILRDPAMDRPVIVKFRDEQVVLYGTAEQRDGVMRPLEGFAKTRDSGYHVVILHASVIDIPTSSGAPSEPVVSKKEIASSGVDYLALGHFHNFARMTCGDTVACYPGTPEGRKFGEDGPRFVAVVELTQSGVHVEQVQMNRRTLTEREVNPALEDMMSQADLVAWLDTLGSPDDLLRVRLVGTPDFATDPAMIHAAVGEFFFYLELVDETSIISADQIRRAAKEPTVRGMFVRKLLAEIEGADGDRERAVAERALRIGISEMGLDTENYVD